LLSLVVHMQVASTYRHSIALPDVFPGDWVMVSSLDSASHAGTILLMT
jgi:hypothetical protein